MQHLGKTLYSLIHAKGWLGLKASLLAGATGFSLQIAHTPQATNAAPTVHGQQLSVRHAALRTTPTQTELVKTIVSETADRYGIPRRIALGLSGHESGGWRMWQDATGEVIQNQNPAVGDRQASSDWGVMQINDLAHPQAFPQAREDLRFNIDYGLRYLAALHRVYKGSLNQGFGDWDVTLAAYHLGHPPDADEMPGSLSYLSKISDRAKTLPEQAFASKSASPRIHHRPAHVSRPQMVAVSFSSESSDTNSGLMPRGL